MWKEHQVMYLIRSSIMKFLIWLTVLIVLWLISSLYVQLIALALLAVPLMNIIINVCWHYMPKQMISKLDDKAVFITGCDSGFGNSLAQRLDKKGITVYAGCLFPDGDGPAQLRQSCSDRLKILQLDVTKEDHVQDAVKTVTSTLGNKKLWAVVNNAGIAPGGEVEWTPTEVCQKTLEVNTVGPYRVSKAFLPLLRRSRGRVVVISSFLGRVNTCGTGAYNMSKHGAASFTETLRRELIKWNVSVHGIEPWIYSTNITNEKLIADDIKRNWNNTSTSVQEDYGESYVERYQKSMCFVMSLKRPSSCTYEVVDSLEHAIIGKDPKIRYVPGLIGQVWTEILRFAPVELFDLGCYLSTPRTVKALN
ncbi:hypothetical protein L9F63_012490 [Diploptera punctata]|uniref:Uncharacterized protein n=1 Tax=Diploptera punctata TaxID=6984 RepID=A0AAD8ACK7_DIPPU|nr:hypothetical protein L9F63_012490 [Diploptera punctata]